MNRNGIILIASLWIIAILAVLAAGIGFRMSLEARLSKYNIDRLRASYLAKAGVFRAEELLAYDSSSDYDTLTECGIAPVPEGETLAGIFRGELKTGSFSVGYKDAVMVPGMTDEERKININKADRQVLKRLFGNDEAADSIAACVIDWRDTNTSPEPGGAENEDYYSKLDRPYKCRNADFVCVEEILLVKGVNVDIYKSVSNLITVYGDGRINLNTAPDKVLIAIGLSQPATDAIIYARVSQEHPNGVTYMTIDDAQAVLIANNIPDLIDRNAFTTRSDYFRIESIGEVRNNGLKKNIVCIVHRLRQAGRSSQLITYQEY